MKNTIAKLWALLIHPITIQTILGVTLILYLFSLWNRYVYIDDAWFGEQAYWFAKAGFPKTPSIIGIGGWDERLFIYHKLNIILGAAIIKLFGFSAYYLKAIALLAYALFFYRYYRFFRFRLLLTNYHYLIAAAFIFIFPITISLSFTYRPEVLVMLMGFISFTFLHRYLSNNNFRLIIFSAVFAGLAFLTHLNGMIFLMAGFGLLLMHKKWKGLMVFSGVAGLVSALFFLDLWQPGHLQQFLIQMREWPDNISTNYTQTGWGVVLSILEKLSQIHQQFFWSDRTSAGSLVFFLVLAANCRFLFRTEKTLLLYLVLLVLLLNLFGSQIAERYLVYFLPYMGIIVSIGLLRLNASKRLVFKGFVIAAMIVQLVFVGKMFVSILARNHPVVADYSRILSPITDKTALTLVDYEYIFNCIETRNLATYKGFEYYVNLHGMLTRDEFFARAQALGIKYIVITDDRLNISNHGYPFRPFSENQNTEHYTLFSKTEDAVILKSFE